MKYIIDIEANGLKNPTKVWVVVLKNIETGDITVIREPTSNEQEAETLRRLLGDADLLVGHFILNYDLPVLRSLLSIDWPVDNTLDTFYISRLCDYSRSAGHSIESYGEEFQLPKMKFSDFSKYSDEMKEYCIRDVDITHKVYLKYLKYIEDPRNQRAIRLEHRFALITNDLENNGFSFNTKEAIRLLGKVKGEIEVIDKEILNVFKPKEVVVKTFIPKVTKHGTISKTSVPRSLWGNIHTYEAGVEYPVIKTVPFNPDSHKARIEILNEAGWTPTDKTTTHILTEREYNRLKYTHVPNKEILLSQYETKLNGLKKTGWKINETNLNTLPPSAPAPARLLAKRILLEARRRSLTEWINLVNPDDNRIHGRFYGIGAWTHRMAHQNPNTANIPREFHEDGTPKLLGREMRSLWQAPRNRLLVGVDAESIQLRIFAHLIDDPEFTDALVKGKKDDKSDPHSLNQRILGDVCKSRQAAKRFIYALLLGGGIAKLAQILGCTIPQAQEALDRLLERYTGFAKIKADRIPRDAKAGFFEGLDGRVVPIPGGTIGERKHLAMSGYLQNGEVIIIKRAAVIADTKLADLRESGAWKFVNIVHDELQSETKNDMGTALRVARTIADAIKQAGEELELKCPLAGSYWNEDIKDYTIGTNWYQTH